MTRCDDCPYRKESPRTIGPRGPADAAIAVVGEAPGTQELAQGQPFIGPSGKLLRRMFTDAGLDLDRDCFITNTLSCKPPTVTDSKERISRKAINACNARLISELTAHPRAVVIGFGATPLRSMTGIDKLSITEKRGQLYDHPAGFVYLPSIHPAYILRGGGNTYAALMQKDIRYATDIASGRRKNPGKPKYAVVEDDSDVDRALSGLMRCTRLAADIETTNLARDTRIYSVGICWAPNKVLIFPWEVIERHRARFKALFENHAIAWAFHNGKFDTARLRRHGFEIDASDDTMLMHYLLEESKGTHGLKDLAASELGTAEWTNDIEAWIDAAFGKGAYKSKSKKVKALVSYGVIPREPLHKYLAADCASTWGLIDALGAQLDADPKLRRVYHNLIIPASNFLRNMEERGMYVDMVALDSIQVQLESDIVSLLEKLRRKAFEQTQGKLTDFNPQSSKQVYDLLYKYMQLKPRASEVKYFGNSTDRADLDRLEDINDVVNTLIDLRARSKMKSVYCVGIRQKLGPDGRIRSNYHLLTKTGRTGSEDPNLQNIKSYDEEKAEHDANMVNIKLILAAPPGRLIMEADYSQAELRTLAALSQDPLLIQVYREGRDLHSEVATRLFGEHYTELDRRKAKTINFGVVYGLTASGVAKRISISEVEAQELIDNWFALMPGAKKFLDWCANHVRLGKPIRSPFGRLRRWGHVDNRNLYKLMNEARNAPVQNTASDNTLTAGCEIAPEIERRWNAYIVNFVHDSLVTEVPNDPAIIAEIAAYMEWVMLDVPRRVLWDRVPFKVDFKIGQSWGSTHKWKAPTATATPSGTLVTV